MTTLWRFLVKFTSLIVCTLHLFRPRHLQGPSRLGGSPRTRDLRRLRSESSPYRLHENHGAPVLRPLGRACPELGAGRPAAPTCIAPASSARTSGLRSLIRDQGISEGLVGILCTLETCPSFALVPGPERPQFVSRSPQQRVLYYYFLDPQFGLIHVRLQTWLPFTVQVYVNGHEWLAQQMVQKKLGFVQQHNAFTQLDDPVQAQRLADRFAKLNWPKILNRWARQVNPLLCELFPGYPVHWVVDQAEYATDLLFTSRAALAGLYRALLDYAVLTFTPKDILRFLGRKWDRRFDGEVHTHYEDDRWFGTRIKHRMKNNWLKMYDKFGCDPAGGNGHQRTQGGVRPKLDVAL